MKDIVIIGTGGFGREVAWLIEDINEKRKEWNLLGFIDDNFNLHGTKIDNYEVLGGTELLNELSVYVICAIGDPHIRKKIVNSLSQNAIKFATLIHPSVIMSKSINIGEGSIICAGNILTVNIEIGKHVIINLGSTIGHDAVIQNFATILPGVNISGNVVINANSTIGTGTVIIQNIAVGEETFVGAGAVVIRDIPKKVTAVGNPSKIIKYINGE